MTTPSQIPFVILYFTLCIMFKLYLNMLYINYYMRFR